jgi:hypothetical protein
MRFADGVHEIARMFELQAQAKGLASEHDADGTLPEVVRADEKRCARSSSTCWATRSSSPRRAGDALRVRHQREMARFEIEDTGPGMSAESSNAHLRALRARLGRQRQSPGAPAWA